MNSVHESIRRALFDTEQIVKYAAVHSPLPTNQISAEVLTFNAAGACALGVQLLATREGWEMFVEGLIAKGLYVESRGWRKHNDAIWCYTLYVEVTNAF